MVDGHKLKDYENVMLQKGILEIAHGENIKKCLLRTFLLIILMKFA